MEQEKILRINELAKKKKEVGLTDEETRERSALYAQYIKEFREQTEATLKRVRVEQEDGSYKPLVKKEKKLNEAKRRLFCKSGKAPLFWMKNGRKGGVGDERKKGHGAVCGAFDDWADDMREYGEGRDFYGGV